ncbi:MAG: hypothetical protein CMO66_00380 [Verrucomicrobiales bacterium]|nr:hypothetical protein [Verrucomicrobiales bacterium]
MKSNRTRNSLMAGLAGLFLLFSTNAVTADATEVNATKSAAGPPQVYNPPQAERTATPGPSNLTEVGLRLFGALLLVVALFLGGAWFFKRSSLFNFVRPAEAHLKVAESKTLATRHNLHVITYGNQRFLIADSPAGTQFLTALDEPPVEESSTGEPGNSANSFADKLKLAIEGGPREPARLSDLTTRLKSFFVRKAS